MVPALRFSMPGRRSVLALTAAAVATLLAPPPSRAASAPCFPGSTVSCHAWYTTALRRRGDGDTIFVRTGGGVQRVRFAGINTQEMSRYSTILNRQRGECHSIAATRNLWRLLARGHWRVRLTALHSSSHSGPRMRRGVSTKIGGRWVDVERAQLARGLALWLPNGIEWPENQEYNRLSQVAAHRGAGMWNPRGCGRGPAPHAQLQVLAAWNANLGDARDLNGEKMIVRNLGNSDVSLRGWVIRNGGAERYHFPRWAIVRAHSQVAVHTGHGRNRAHDFYFGRGAPYLDNMGRDYRHLASGVYLFDPRGNIRGHQIYPCMVACGSPLWGRVRLVPQPRGTEYVDVVNVSQAPIDLEGNRLQLYWLSYWFDSPTIVPPGDRLRIYGDSAPRRGKESGVLTRSWDLHPNLLPDSEGAARLESFDAVQVDCATWGRASCSSLP
jgi:endonuclease YncB( thermonuclease family)